MVKEVLSFIEKIEEIRRKKVRLSKGATSGNIYLPKSWAGEEVLVIKIKSNGGKE